MLGVPSQVLSLGLLNPASDNSSRLKAVKAFYEKEESSSEVRRQCLCLRLTLFATSLTAQNHISTETFREPLLVRLGRGQVQQRTSALFSEIVSLLMNDPALDLSKTLLSLMVTQAHLVIRFDMYLRYPTSLWRMTRRYNLQSYAAEILEFLYTDDDILDIGYSLRLNVEAWNIAKRD